jgi:hypothetical protein
MYFYGIEDVDSYFGYFMDYAIYGAIYPAVGFDTDFVEIDFEVDDILCYNLNGYDPEDSSSSIPTYTQTAEATANGDTCTSAGGVRR